VISGFLKDYRLARRSCCLGEGEGFGLSLAVVRDLRVARAPATPDDLAALETDVLAGFVLARAAAGLADSTIRNDNNHLELIRDWFGRPLWEMQPSDADTYFGKVVRDAKPSTRTGRRPLARCTSSSWNCEHVGLEVGKLLLGRRRPMLAQVAHHGQSQPPPLRHPY
jgi:hypothetical protein